jgi:hypothetical protein
VDNWDEDTEIESDPEVDPPDDLFQPTRGFGKVWRERLTDDQRETLGWATSPEIGYTTEYRFEAGGFVDSAGTYVERPGMHSLITFGNEVIIFDESGETAEFATEE